MNADELITEKDITIEKIKEIYSSAFIRFEPHESDDGFYVVDGRPGFNLILQKDMSMIRFLTYFEIDPNIDELTSLKCINNKNLLYRVVRTHLEDDSGKKILTFDYYISFKGGITPYHLINEGRIFQSITNNICMEEDIRKLMVNQ